MEEKFISKKELLELTGISYGQLYRWKRMDIIPESWFIKRSSFTGQETFFPKEKIVERIDKIVKLKDEYSLEELAKLFSPNPAEIELTEEALRSKHLLTEETINKYKSMYTKLHSYSFGAIYFMYVCEMVSKSTGLSIDECLVTFTFIHEHYKEHGKISQELVGIEKGNQLIWFMVPIQVPIFLEQQARVLKRYNLLEIMNQVKMKLTGLQP